MPAHSGRGAHLHCGKGFGGKVIISQGNLQAGMLQGKVAIVTGAGGGIGLEAARALVWLGARVVLAELDQEKGRQAEQALRAGFGQGCAYFQPTDVSDEGSVAALRGWVLWQLGRVDVVVNNATIAVVGAAHQLDIGSWDQSYAVNLRGPILFARHFLPEMLQQNSGTMMFVSSSGAAPYLGGYEVFKTAQVELANTLAAELEQTGVHCFSIGPGIVKTETASRAIAQAAPLYGMSVEQFYAMNEDKLLSSEAAGAGFAAAVVLAERYRGTEIGSIQALMDCGISLVEADSGTEEAVLPGQVGVGSSELLQQVRQTLSEQVAGWQQRNIFERQWMLRDFRKQTGSSPEAFLQHLERLQIDLQSGRVQTAALSNLQRLGAYYRRLLEMMRGYQKDPVKVSEQTEIISGWITQVDEILQQLGN